MATLTRHRHTAKIAYFREPLGDTVTLDMVYIPGGQFMMGSPASELDRRDNEGPQHLVTVPPFFMGRYPITQSQWRKIAEGHPQAFDSKNPSRFDGNDHHPVESVSWDQAVLFCELLSQQTQRTYRLPSEAEWEYACRAGTETPFHTGETLSTDLANYNGSSPEYGAYGQGTLGEYRESTTPVGVFPPNAFGLHDMHGNVWEWCLDHWQDSYQGAPIDGSARTTSETEYRVRRGGSWLAFPRNCRSAFRLNNTRGNPINYIGFRVICIAPRT